MSTFGVLVTVVGIIIGVVGVGFTLWTVIPGWFSRSGKLRELEKLRTKLQETDSPQSKDCAENRIKEILTSFSMRDYVKDQRVASQVDWYFDHLGEIRRTRSGREASRTRESEEEAQEDSEAGVIDGKQRVQRFVEALARSKPESAVRTEPLPKPSRTQAESTIIDAAKVAQPPRTRARGLHPSIDTTRMYEFPIKKFFKQPRSLLGAGAYEQAGPGAAVMGLRHVLFVTSGLSGTGIIDECMSNFESAGVSVTVYDQVESNPKDYNVMATYNMFTENECDGFVSIGGGSSHDTAKSAKVMVAHEGRNVNEFQGLNQSEKLETPPCISINTTVGTGAETTPFVVVADLSSEKAPHKWVGADEAFTSTLAINDPVLCMMQPPEFVAFTGFNTIASASEAYVSRIQHRSGTVQALEAIRLTQLNLRDATYNPNNYEAMEGMVWAQYIAGQAASSNLLGILHALSDAVCAYYDIHQGLSNGVGIARVWTFNQPAQPQRFADIAKAMDDDTSGLSPIKASDKAIDAVIRLARDCGIPDNFSAVNPNYAESEMGRGTFYENRPTEIQSDDQELEAIGQHMMEDLWTAANPRDLTLEAAKEILRDCVYDPMDRKTTEGYRQNVWGADPRMGREAHSHKGSKRSIL